MAQRQNLDPAKDRAILRQSDLAAKTPTSDVPEHPVLALQHQIGNAQVARMLGQRASAEEEEVQAKRVDRQIAQRASAEEEGPAAEGEEVQAKRIDRQLAQRASGEEDEVQMKREADAPVVGPEGGDLDAGVSNAIQARRGGGSPMDDATRDAMESGFGASFSNVRIHTDSSASSLNRQLSAKAFTTGSDIFFSDGAYQPGSSEGRSLLSHELAHVVQQRSMSSSGPMRVSPAGDAHEQEADAMAAKVVSQQSTQQSTAQRATKDE